MYLPLHMVIFQLTMLGFRARRLTTPFLFYKTGPHHEFKDPNFEDITTNTKGAKPQWRNKQFVWQQKTATFCHQHPFATFYAPQKMKQGSQKHLFDWHLFVGVLYLYTPPKTNGWNLKMDPCKGQRFRLWKPSFSPVPCYFSGVFPPTFLRHQNVTCLGHETLFQLSLQ